VRGIEAKDPAAAQAALRKHLSGTLSAVDEICRQYPDYVAA
jgi:DNA-binding GntR family transcriptional regulator